MGDKWKVFLANYPRTSTPREDVHMCCWYTLVSPSGIPYNWRYRRKKDLWDLVPPRMVRTDIKHNSTLVAEVDSKEAYIEAWEKARKEGGVFGVPVFEEEDVVEEEVVEEDPGPLLVIRGSGVSDDDEEEDGATQSCGVKLGSGLLAMMGG